LASCVSCGLCLPHCPTYRVSQEETASPRGRIALMRQVESTGVADDTFTDFMDECIQCRGCETACPSGVPFGSMMETTREALADQTKYQPKYRRLGYSILGMPRVLSIGSRLIAVFQRLRIIPSRLALPKIPLRQTKLKASGDDVWLFTGCIMDAWMRDTHAAVKRVVESTGAGVRLPGN
ncbi:MAG: 4Fe-4S dicluster domain-containing protein, partial [Acidimicrobiales bacterium]